MKMKNNEKKLVILFALALLVLLFGCKSNMEYHNHTFSTTWSNNKLYHWHEATCEHTEYISDSEEHTFSEWSTIKEATFTNEGLEQQHCIICNYIKEKIVQRLKETAFDPNDGHKIVINYYDDGVSKEETHYSTDNEIDCVIYYGSTGKPYKYVKYKEGHVYFYHKAQKDNYIYEVHTNNDGTVDYIEEYDNSNDKLVYIAYYTYYNSQAHPDFTYKANSGNYIYDFSINSDGSEYYIEEYNNSTGKLVCIEQKGVLRYEAEDGNYISVYKKSDGSVDYVEEYNNSTGKLVKYKKYKNYEWLDFKYRGEDGKYISVFNNSDGSVYYVEEYDNSTEKLVKITYFDSNGKVSYIVQATDGNYFSINKDPYGNVDSIEEYDSSTGKLVRTTKFYQKSIGKVDYIYEYDSSGDKIVNITYYKRDESGSVEYSLQYQAAEGNYISITYNQDGAVKCIEEFNSTTRKLVKYMIYNSKGIVTLQYQIEDGKYISVINNSDGTVDYIDEYDTSTGKVVKRIVCLSDGTVDYIDEYDTSTEKVVKKTKYNRDGSVAYYTIYEYATSTGNIVKKTVYDPDGSVSDYYDYSYHSSGYIIYRYRSDRTKYMTIEYVLSSDGSDYDLKKITEYNPDGTINRVTKL